jgi:hypothetical protein
MSKKKKQKGAEAPEGVTTISVKAHPRARASVRRTRARTALAAFAIVLFVCLSGSVPPQEAFLRALIAGLIGNLVGWACALAVWRAIVVQEVRTVAENRRARARARAEAAAADAR